MTMPSVEWLTAFAAVLTAVGALVLVLVKAIRALVRVFLDLRKEVLETKAEAATLKEHVNTVSEKISEKITEGQNKLDTINEKTTKTLENTNGSLGRVLDHADALQAELERLRQRDEVRQERERVMERTFSELTTMLAASQAAMAKVQVRPSVAGGQRADDQEDKK